MCARRKRSRKRDRRTDLGMCICVNELFRVQAVIIQPISSTRAFILGADKPRPLTGADFGWVQAVANRLGDAEE